MINPYQPNYQPNYQPTYQQRPGISGRRVNTVDEIQPQEIPMDGSFAIFPANDGMIYGKRWASDGRIETIRYTPDQQPQKSPIDTLNAKIDMIIEKLSEGGNDD